MQIVIDSNIFFSSLIKDSLPRSIILNFKLDFLFPVYIFEELFEHKLEIQKKSGLSKEDFRFLLKKITKKVQIVSTKKLLDFKEQALSIVKEIDEEDAMFFACALANPGSIIWSEDKALKKQKVIKIFNTSELLVLLSEQSF